MDQGPRKEGLLGKPEWRVRSRMDQGPRKEGLLGKPEWRLGDVRGDQRHAAGSSTGCIDGQQRGDQRHAAGSGTECNDVGGYEPEWRLGAVRSRMDQGPRK